MKSISHNRTIFIGSLTLAIIAALVTTVQLARARIYNPSSGSSISTPISIANGGTATSTGGVTNGVEYYDGTKITNGSKLVFTGSLFGLRAAVPAYLFSLGETSGGTGKATPTYSTNDQAGFCDFYISNSNSERYLDICANGGQNGSAGGAGIRFLANPNNSNTAVEVARISASTNKFQIGTTTSVSNFQVTNSASNATTTIETGKAGQNKGTCEKKYRYDGTAIYVSYDNTNAQVISTTACASVVGF